jgi:hypothetical protein
MVEKQCSFLKKETVGFSEMSEYFTWQKVVVVLRNYV